MHDPKEDPSGARSSWVMSRFGSFLLGFADHPGDDFDLRRARRIDVLANLAAAIVHGTLAGILVYMLTG